MGWKGLPEEDKKKHFERKIDGACKQEFLNWLDLAKDDLPQSYSSQGPEQKLEIIFGAIELDWAKARTRTFEILVQMNLAMSLIDDFSFIDKMKPKGMVINMFT